MTADERERLLNVPFDTLWDSLWGISEEGGHAYRNEREQSKNKLTQLMNAIPSLKTLCDTIPVIYDTPEWGFPKGRRELHESEYMCAMREFYEETNISHDDIYTLRNVEPISENFTGTNSVRYCHKYIIAYVPQNVGENLSIVPKEVNPHMLQEVGDIRWCSLEEALSLIRASSVEKRAVLLRVDNILREFYPVRLG
jgi:8-oxo-dGTP pyrophosphatase MutT (NUDIX family)